MCIFGVYKSKIELLAYIGAGPSESMGLGGHFFWVLLPKMVKLNVQHYGADVDAGPLEQWEHGEHSDMWYVDRDSRKLENPGGQV